MDELTVIASLVIVAVVFFFVFKAIDESARLEPAPAITFQCVDGRTVTALSQCPSALDYALPGGAPPAATTLAAGGSETSSSVKPATTSTSIPTVACLSRDDCPETLKTNAYCRDGVFKMQETVFRCVKAGSPEAECKGRVEEKTLHSRAATSCKAGDTYPLSCFDGLRDSPERGVDCGGGCVACNETLDSECASDFDCGDSGFVGAAYCWKGDVYKTWRDWECTSPGTPDADCVEQESKRYQNSCAGPSYCENGACTVATF